MHQVQLHDGDMPFYTIAYRQRCHKEKHWLVHPMALQWRHNGRDGVSNHQTHDCLLNHLFRRRSRKTSKLSVIGLYEGNAPVTCEFPHKGPVTRKIHLMTASWNHYCEHGQETTQTIQWPGSLGQIYIKIHAWHQFSHITGLCCPRNRNRICKLFCLKWILIRKLLKKIGNLVKSMIFTEVGLDQDSLQLT